MALSEGSLQIVRAVRLRKWAEPVMKALAEQPLRYTEISRTVILATGRNLHSHTLTDTLKWLETQRMVVPGYHREDSTYDLTPCAHQVLRIVEQLDVLDEKLGADNEDGSGMVP